MAEVGVEAKIENVEWAQWLSGVYQNKNFDLTIISHVEPLDIGIYANPDYYFQYDSREFRDIYAKLTAGPDLDTFKELIGKAQRKLADDSVNVFLFQLEQLTVADAISPVCGRIRQFLQMICRRYPGNNAKRERETSFAGRLV